MRICCRFTMVLLFLGVLSGSVYGQTPFEPFLVHHEASVHPTQSTAGGSTAQTVTPAASYPVMISPDAFFSPAPLITDTPPPSQVPPAERNAAPVTVGAGLGVNILYSRHIKAYTIPASYLVTPNLKLEVDIPYVEKTLKGEFTGQELTTRGLGDISAVVKYHYGSEKVLEGITNFYVKFPTGRQEQFSGGKEQLALGSGSYDFALQQTLIKLVGPFRLLANVGYILNTKSDYTETDNFGRLINFENKAGNIFNYLVGVDYYTPIQGLIVYLNAAGLFMERSHIRETNTTNNLVLLDENKKNRLSTLDLNPGLKFVVTNNISLRLGVIIPAWTKFDPDVTNTEKREVLVDFGLAGRF